jgi:hypothetical protein
MRMNTLGLYERAVHGSLARLHPRPWTRLDLARVEELLDHELRRMGIAGRTAEITDWLKALAADDLADLIDRLNEVGRPVRGF